MTLKKRFAVRTLLIITAVVALLFAWVSKPLSLYRAEQQAIKEIREAGGSVRKDRASPGKRANSKFRLQEAHWTSTFFGVDIFARVRSVDSGTKADDAALSQLGSLAGVESVTLSSPSLGEATVLQLARLPQLKFLALNGVTFPPTALSKLTENCPQLRRFYFSDGNATADYLGQLPSSIDLEYLYLEGSECDDLTMEKLQDVNSIDQLEIHRASITDEGLRYLSKHSSLQALRLVETNVGGNGLAMLGAMPKLVLVDLVGTLTDDSSMSWICGLESLRILRLAGTNVTDKGLQLLAEGKNSKLSHLTITISDQLTRPAIQQIRNAYPNCEILCQEEGIPLFFEFDQRFGQ